MIECAPESAGTALRPADLGGLVDQLGALPAAVDDAERIDRIAALERLRSAVAAAQMREMTEFAASQLAAQMSEGVPARRRGNGIAEQIGLARHMSPAAAARQLTAADALATELPDVLALLRRGQISEWVAQIVVRETVSLPTPVRRGIGADLAPDLPAMGPRQAEAAARRLSYQADPAAIMARGRTARADRRVGIRPAPDTMAVLSAFLPAEQGIAAWANLDRHARSRRADGDPRTLGQVMADTLVERLTGQAAAAAVPVEVGLTMTADSLLASEVDRTPADLHGYGPIPADVALDLTARATSDLTDTSATDLTDAEARTAVWVRRLFIDPVDETIAHLDTKRRRFDGGLARLIRYRDRLCRDPYCTAPIRHLDHVEPYRNGGSTAAANGAGLCEQGNYAKDMPGWSRQVVSEPGQTHEIEICTPTGHRYRSQAPPALGLGGNQRALDRRRALRRLGSRLGSRTGASRVTTLPRPPT